MLVAFISKGMLLENSNGAIKIREDNMRKAISIIGIGFITGFLTMLPTLSRSATYAGNLTTIYSTSHPGANPSASPYGTVTLTDDGVGKVLATFTAGALIGPEYISAFDLNYNPSLNVNDLKFTYVSGTPLSASPILDSNHVYDGQADDFDIGLNFKTDPWDWLSNGSGYSSSSFIITTTQGNTTLDAADFNFAESDGNYAGAWVEGIPLNSPSGQQDWNQDEWNCDRYGSAWVGAESLATASTPEPCTLAFMGLGMAGAAVMRRRKMKNAN